MGDTGLLISHAFDERGIVNANLYRKLMFDKLEVNEGMLVVVYLPLYMTPLL